MRARLTVVAMAVGIGLACGGEPTVTDVTAPVAAAPGGDDTPLLLTGVELGTVMCTRKDGDRCLDPTTTFAPDTPVIYFVHQTTDIPKTGQTYNIRWTAVDVGTAAPAGTVVANLDEEVTDLVMVHVATHYTVASEMSKPTAGWPVGSYRVDVTRDGAPVTSAEFTVR